MLSSKQNDLYNTIKTKRIPVIEKEDDFYIINKGKVSRITDYIFQRFSPIENPKNQTEYNDKLKKIRSLINCHFEMNKIEAEDLEQFLSKMNDHEIELIESYINRIYIY